MHALGNASKDDMRGVLNDLKASEVLNQEQCERISEEHTAELHRLDAEGERLSAESKRLSAESKRLSRESNRRSQEVQRAGEERRRESEQRIERHRSRSQQASSQGRTSEEEPRASVRGGLGRMVNAAASAVEEHFDAELEDKPVRIPSADRFEAIRDRQRAMHSFVNASATAPPPQPPSSQSSEPNHPVEREPNCSLSPFGSDRLQSQPIEPPPNRRLIRGSGLATMERRGNSLDVQSQGRPSAEPKRPSPPQRPPLHRQPRDSLDIAQGRANSYQVAQVNRQQLRGQASEQAVNRLIPTGPVVESVHDVEGQVLRRRVAFPWYYTASLQGGIALGLFVGMVTLGLAIRNTLYLQGPKAAAKVGDLSAQLGQIQGALDTLVQLNAGMEHP